MLHKLIRGTALGVTLLLSASSSFGQAVYGSIFGTVTDTTGAVVPNATITVIDTAKGTSVTATTNSSGEFTVEHLIPDAYDVKIVASGFKGYQQTGIQLFADTSTKVAAALTIGDAAGESVTVSADSVPQLKTDRADVSTVFTGQAVQDLPIGDRNFTNLQLLLPGAQLLGWSHAPDENPQGSRQIQVDGQAFGGTAFELDGTDNQDPILGIIVINPNIDSLAESKITTQNFDAEFGKAVSAVVTAQTKSGTNSFHGSAFDFRTSTANLAKDPYQQFPANGSTPASNIAPGLKNQFGGSIGGPILKDKLFFFGDYQGARQRVGTQASSIVPTALATSSCLSGNGCNFSEYTNLGGTNNGQVYQSNGQPYAGNIIPNSQLSAPALNYLKLLAPYVPNKASISGGPLDTYTQGGTGIFNSNQWDARVDYTLSQRIHTFARFSRFTDVLSGNTLFGTGGGPGFGLGNYGGSSTGANDSLAAGADVAVTSKLVTDFRIGYYRYNVIDQKFDQSTQEASALGFGGLNIAGVPITNGLAGFQVAQPGGTGQWGAGLNINRCNCPLIEKEDQYQVVNNWTKAIGNHSVKFGADLRYARNLRVPSDTDRTGLFQFTTTTTSNKSLTTPGGLGLASFVLGEPGHFGRYVSTSTNAKEFQKRDFFYVQDTWRATQKLTVNYGLRYEIYFPEAVNGPGNGALMDLSTGYLHVAGIGGVPSDMGWGQPKNAYNPRIGLAYQVTDKTVIRAGYGRSFDIGVFGSIFGHVVTQNLPVLADQEIDSGNTDAVNYKQLFTLAGGPPTNPTVSVPANGLLPAPGYAVTPKARPNPLRLPTLDAWNLSLQQAVTPTLTLTMAYVGNKGTHTLSAGDGNNTNPNEAAINLPASFSGNGQALHYDPNGGTCLIASATCTTSGLMNGAKVGTLVNAGGGASNQNLLQRYYGGKLPACSDAAYAAQPGVPSGACGWTNSVAYYGDDQDTHYNALQITLAKQLTHGLSLTGNYAWQRAFNFNSQYATWDKQAGKGRDDSTREQQLVAYGTYELPFGHNQLFASKVNGLVNEFIGGWQLSPVLTLSSGLPFSLSYNECGKNVPGSVPCYPNGNPRNLQTSLGKFDPVAHNRTYYQAVSNNIATNPADGFTSPSLDQIGNTGRNSNFGPGFFNTDLALLKNFPIRESISAQFRVDAFNAFNHINAGNPGGNIESPGTIGGGAGGVGVASPRQLAFTARIQF